jgi:hypothetical protein
MWQAHLVSLPFSSSRKKGISIGTQVRVYGAFAVEVTRHRPVVFSPLGAPAE